METSVDPVITGLHKKKHKISLTEPKEQMMNWETEAEQKADGK